MRELLNCWYLGDYNELRVVFGIKLKLWKSSLISIQCQVILNNSWNKSIRSTFVEAQTPIIVKVEIVGSQNQNFWINQFAQIFTILIWRPDELLEIYTHLNEFLCVKYF